MRLAGVDYGRIDMMRLPDGALAVSEVEAIAQKVLIINNNYLGMVRQWQEFFYERRYAATPRRSPDFV